MTAATAGGSYGPSTAGRDRPDAGPPSPIAVTTDEGTVVLAVADALDDAAAVALVDAASAAVAARSERIDVDLRRLETFTALGAQALVTCRDLASSLPEGLHYRTGRGPGRDALMAAYEDVESGYGR